MTIKQDRIELTKILWQTLRDGQRAAAEENKQHLITRDKFRIQITITVTIIKSLTQIHNSAAEDTPLYNQVNQ